MQASKLVIVFLLAKNNFLYSFKQKKNAASSRMASCGGGSAAEWLFRSQKASEKRKNEIGLIVFVLKTEMWKTAFDIKIK